MRWRPRWEWDDEGYTQWRRKFAWHPVFVEGQWMWLEPYEVRHRAWGWGFLDTFYRLPKEQQQ